jgi:hypothetical protein
VGDAPGDQGGHLGVAPAGDQRLEHERGLGRGVAAQLAPGGAQGGEHVAGVAPVEQLGQLVRRVGADGLGQQGRLGGVVGVDRPGGKARPAGDLPARVPP